jgi:hypothetical protein
MVIQFLASTSPYALRDPTVTRADQVWAADEMIRVDLHVQECGVFERTLRHPQGLFFQGARFHLGAWESVQAIQEPCRRSAGTP